MDSRLSVRSIDDAPDFIAGMYANPAFGAIEAHPQIGAYGRAYYPMVHGAQMIDQTFVVCWQGEAVLACPCTVLEGVLGLNGLPLQLFTRAEVDGDVLKKAVKAAFGQLDAVAARHGVSSVWLREKASPVLSDVALAALGREAQARVALVGCVNLKGGAALWKGALRKSFQQFVNWGQRSLAMEHVNAHTGTQVQFERYRDFHAKVAGRVTRSRASWDMMENHVRAGHGELLLAELDGQLAAGSLFIDGTQTTIYMTGVYDRELDKPLAHYLVWHGMERAAARGMATLELGDIHLKADVDDKLFAIGYFKRGFATHIEQWTDWRWSPKA
jgi:Acetyltransferase (GNAT) domain